MPARSLLVSICCFCYGALCHAQIVANQAVLFDEYELVRSILDSSLAVSTRRLDFGGQTIWITDDFEIHSLTIGARFGLISVAEGDLLTQENLLSFPSIEFSGPVPPIGGGDDFYVGFGTAEPVEDAPWGAIGWMMFHRADSGLELLGSATSLGDPPWIEPSPGITVGVVPEPSIPTLLLLASLFAVVRFVALDKMSS